LHKADVKGLKKEITQSDADGKSGRAGERWDAKPGKGLVTLQNINEKTSKDWWKDQSTQTGEGMLSNGGRGKIWHKISFA